MHIGLHKLLLFERLVNMFADAVEVVTYLNQVDFGERFIISGLLNVKNRDDVLVVEVSEELHLTKCTQAEHGVIEGGDLLDCDLLS